MNNVVKINSKNAVAPADMNPAQLKLVKSTLAKDCNESEFDLFIEMAKRHGLDPIRRQIYAMVTNKDKPDKRQLVVVTGIDGYRAKAARCGDYRPDENEPVITYSDALKDEKTNPLGIEKAVVTCYKQDNKGDWNKVSGVAYWDEFAPVTEDWEYDQAQGKRVPTGRMSLSKGNWSKMGRVMIAKCAEAQALRKGWPEEFGGLYISEEMDTVSASEAVEQAEIERRLAITNGKNSISIQFKVGEPIEAIPVGGFFDRVMNFVNNAESPTEITSFMHQNKQGLSEFWALNKSDGLELKKGMEARIAKLSDQQ
ncbi:MAG TPA: phage recombination protein Bet [Hyphomonas sp.]|jgi:phage recombination protein Bet|uniref:phage recombination protein Bet n=1 Tax=Hyphomonas sp. TaxID=87 RepID=UPI000E8DC960|nr:phage recombination protein Bet [Hyphomonas sp.]QDP49117.1 MAG: putative RecT [Prokaryotic dsDNA virus sp.]HBN92216.1 phage recombination protein Bet [Hyphomonas sp.]|tara:strand:- start:36175 stop:37107 length:933 start_codon:yes stop_codon:yes gene_type:complete